MKGHVCTLEESIVKLKSIQVTCVEWLKISLFVDETEGCGKYIKPEDY